MAQQSTQFSIRMAVENKTKVERAARAANQSLTEFVEAAIVHQAAEDFGLIGVALDLLHEPSESKSESQGRRDYSEKRGFQPLLDDENRLHLPMSVVRKMKLAGES